MRRLLIVAAIIVGVSVAYVLARCETPNRLESAGEQVQPGKHLHGEHHMNIPMGEEACDPVYTYEEGPRGPSHWAGVCNTGNMQSPIDIQHPERMSLPALDISYQATDLDVINDCNKYRILVRFPDNRWLKVGKKPYFLSELHFRQPGENAVNGKRPVMSVQFVHLSPESRFLIVEVPVVAGKENAAFKTVLEHLATPGKEDKIHTVKINPMNLMPVDRTFYRFPGSLTTPICNEGVTWYVMKNPVEFSGPQIAEYMKYYHNTARPVQPANRRPIGESQ